jgi:hypothetical protein
MRSTMSCSTLSVAGTKTSSKWSGKKPEAGCQRVFCTRRLRLTRLPSSSVAQYSSVT